EQLWGLIGFDDCERVRSWSGMEIDALRSAAHVIGELFRARQAEADLRTAKRQMERLLQNSSDAIFAVDLEGRFIYVNAACEAVSGYSREELLQMRVYDLMSKPMRKLAKQRMRARVQGESFDQPVTGYLQCKENQPVPVEVATTPLYEGGKLVGVQGIARDVTARMEAKRAIQNQAAFQATLAAVRGQGEAIAEDELWGVLVSTLASEYELPAVSYWRPTQHEDVRCVAEACLAEGTRCRKYRDRGRELAGEAVRTGKTCLEEAEDMHLLALPAGDYRGSAAVVLAAGTLTELTRPVREQAAMLIREVRSLLDNRQERLRAEQTLERERAALNNMIDLNPYAIIVFNRDGKCIRYNSALVKLFGSPPPEDYNILQDPHFADTEAMRALRRAFQGKEVSVRESDLNVGEYGEEYPDSPLYLRSALFPIQDEFGQVDSVVVMHEDITERKLAEDALVRSQKRFRQMAELLPMAISETDRNFRFTYVNQMGLETFGYTEADLEAGVTIWDVLHPDGHDKARRRLELLFRGVAEESGVEYTMVRKDGSTLPALLKSSLIFREAEFAGVRSCIADITELKEAETALRRSEENYRLLVESADEAIFVLDRDGYCHFINSCGAGYFDKTPEDIIGRNLLQFFPKDIMEKRLQDIREVLDTGRRMTMELSLPFDGTVCWFRQSIQPVRKPGGPAETAMIIARDVTELRSVQDEVRRREQLFRSVFESSDNGIIVLDTDLRFLYVNQAYADHVQQKVDDLIDKTLSDALRHLPKFRDLWIHRIQRVTDTGKPMHVEDNLPVGDRMIWSESDLSPLRDQDGTIYAVAVVYRDVTETKLAELALRDAHRKLMNAREEERRFLASELHDSIGQSLVVLRLGIQAALAEFNEQVAPEGTRRLSGISQQTAELIREVRQICHGLYPPTLSSLGLAAALDHLVSYCNSGEVEVSLDTCEEVKRCRYPHEVQIAVFRIAQEALNNALRHSKASNIHIDLYYSDGWLHLEIDDDGVGFSTSDKRSGIGLSSMKQRAQAVAGDIRIDSDSDGTVVALSVPATGKAAEEVDGGRLES
ncbi:MAG: PAS domain S-box protein, partial [Phycisphaerae bacterium]